ncbi:uncharacterized protein [Castor canadensis]|uniref:Uncharacterized protein n=1 Tax=Castor canadensis TaxID=51338 RepID=A0AC58JYN9_CASCN
MGGLPRHIQGACGCPAIPVAHRSLTPPARHSSRALGLAMVPHSTVLACVQPRTARGAAQRSRGCLKGAAAADVLLCQQLQQQWWQKLACSTAPGVEPDEFEMESQMKTEATSKDILGGSCTVRNRLPIAEVPKSSRAPSCMHSSAVSMFHVCEKTGALCVPEPAVLTFTWCAQTAAIPPPSRSHSFFLPKTSTCTALQHGTFSRSIPQQTFRVVSLAWVQ